MSEFDRQAKLFADKIHKPDHVFLVCSVMKADGDDGTVYHFLTDDDQLVRVDMRDTRGKDSGKPVENSVGIPSEDAFIQERLKTYDKFWNEELQKYLIDDDPNDPEAWCPTKQALINDIKKSYKFEYEDETKS